MKFVLRATRLVAVMSLGLVALTGCLDDAIYKPTNQFNYKEVEWATKRGTNTVTGKINAPGSDGKSHTCATVGLAPDSAYVREIRMKQIGTLEDATVFKKDVTPLFQYDDWQRNQTTRARDCGWSGHFTFDRIPDGIWYLTVSGGPSKTGYFISRRLELRGNEKIVINIP